MVTVVTCGQQARLSEVSLLKHSQRNILLTKDSREMLFSIAVIICSQHCCFSDEPARAVRFDIASR